MLLLGRRERRCAEAAQRSIRTAGRAGWPWTSPRPTPASASCRPAGSASAASTCSSTTPAPAPCARSSELTDEEWQAQWEINVMAPMRLMRAAIPVMVEAGWGRVVNVSSSSGKRPGQRNVAYSVTKAAELSLSRAYADAYASHGRAGQRGHAGAGGQRAVARTRRAGRPDRAAARHDAASRCWRRPPPALPLGRLGRAAGDRRRDRVPVFGGGLERGRRRLVGRRRRRAGDHLRSARGRRIDCRTHGAEHRGDRQDLPARHLRGRAARRSRSTPTPSARPTRCTSTSRPPAPPATPTWWRRRCSPSSTPAGRSDRRCSTPRSGSTSRYGPRRPGVPLGPAGRGRRRDHDHRDRQGHLRARRDGLLRVRDRVREPARRDRLRRHLDQHRPGDWQ